MELIELKAAKIIPSFMEWLVDELIEYPHPAMLIELLKLYGTVEAPGAADNPVILAWAKEVGLDKVYQHDSVAWCGLTEAVAAVRAGFLPPKDPLWALNWKNFGVPIPIKDACLGDIGTKKRSGGGHVFTIIGKDQSGAVTWQLSGNQGDKISFGSVLTSDITSVTRPKYNVPPTNIRQVILNKKGLTYLSEK